MNRNEADELFAKLNHLVNNGFCVGMSRRDSNLLEDEWEIIIF